MNKIYVIFISFLIYINNSYSQKFSLFDNFEVGIRPIEYVINNWNVHYSIFNSVYIEIRDPLQINDEPLTQEFDPIQLKNYFTAEYDFKYFLKAYKNFKIGIGINYKKRKLEYDVYLRPNAFEPGSYFTIWALKYKANYNYLGFNLNFRWYFPKIKSSVNFYWEPNYSLTSDKRQPQLSIYYQSSYLLWIESRNPFPNSIVDGTCVGLDVNVKLWKLFYLNFHVSYKYDSDYNSRFGFYYLEDINHPNPIYKGIIRSNDFILGLGFIYHLSKFMPNLSTNQNL